MVDLARGRIALTMKKSVAPASTDGQERAKSEGQKTRRPAEKPPAVSEILVKQSSERGEIVADPFMGSGSTAVAAVRTGRHYVGIETEPEYVQAARDRLAGEGP